MLLVSCFGTNISCHLKGKCVLFGFKKSYIKQAHSQAINGDMMPILSCVDKSLSEVNSCFSNYETGDNKVSDCKKCHMR